MGRLDFVCAGFVLSYLSTHELLPYLKQRSHPTATHHNLNKPHTGATLLIENGYAECGLELGGVILDVATEADKEAAKQQQQQGQLDGDSEGGPLQPVPADLVRACRGKLCVIDVWWRETE